MILNLAQQIGYFFKQILYSLFSKEKKNNALFFGLYLLGYYLSMQKKMHRNVLEIQMKQNTRSEE